MKKEEDGVVVGSSAVVMSICIRACERTSRRVSAPTSGRVDALVRAAKFGCLKWTRGTCRCIKQHARRQHPTRAMDSPARSARAERTPAAERRLTVWPVRLGNERFLRKKALFFGALRAQRLHGMGRRSAAEKLHG